MELIEQIKIIAKKAGDKAMEFYNIEYDIKQKDNDGEESPVTQADLASEKVILEGIDKLNLDYGILSEETDETNDRFNKERVWIIDPLDGTMDFIQKTGDFSIIIGLAEKGKPILGVVYQPITDTYYFAEKNNGAFKQIGNNAPEQIHISNRKNFSEMKMMASRNHLKELEQNFAKEVNIKEFVKSGSAGLKLCKVAEGIGDIYMNTSDKTGEWDTCAGEIILSEAGGKFTDMNGEDFIYNRKEVKNVDGFIGSNGFLHNEIVDKTNQL